MESQDDYLFLSTDAALQFRFQSAWSAAQASLPIPGRLHVATSLEAAPPGRRTYNAFFLDVRCRPLDAVAEGPFFDAPVIAVVPDGQEMTWAESAFDVLSTSELQPQSIRRILRLIREHRRRLHDVDEIQARMSLVAAGAADGLWEWDPDHQRMLVSGRCQAIVGFPGEGMIAVSDRVLGRIHPKDQALFWANLHAHKSGRTAIFESDFRLRHRQGAYRWVRARGVAERAANGAVVRMAGSLTDVTKTKLIEDQLLHDAFHDVLTGLPNRVVLVDLLERALARGWRDSKNQFAVLTLDVDRFKVINDSVGQSEGDRLLTAVSRRLLACVRPADTVVRLGGDEFAILLQDVASLADALRVAERIHEEFRQPLVCAKAEVFTTFSIGVAVGDCTHHRAEEVLRDADTALHWAKEKGRGRTEVFDHSMRVNAVNLMRLDTDLRRAVGGNSFRLHYQPIVCLCSGEIVAFEALARWAHPQHGEIPPSKFIPLAEENGLILPLGEWVLYEACRQTVKWQRQFPRKRPIEISVNLSPRQFRSQDLIRDIDRICKETGIDMRTLRLEITESVMMEDAVTTLQVLEELHRRNIKLHVDDFGTGYSSLSTLPAYPVDTLKIDRSFVQDIDSKNASAEIVRTIVHLGRNLKMGITAEGVETSGQAAVVKQLQCQHGQGYYFSPPVDPNAAAKLLASAPQWLANSG